MNKSNVIENTSITCPKCSSMYLKKQNGVLYCPRCKMPLEELQRGNIDKELLEFIKQDKYKTCDVDGLDKVMQIVNSKKSLFMYGDVGIGKTHLLYWLCNKKNIEGRHVHFWKTPKLINEIFQEIKTYDKKSIVNILEKCDVLFLDDLGNENFKDFQHDKLIQIIDYRYEHNKETYISSNYSLYELHNIWKEKVGKVKSKQMIDRIKTFGAIELKGKNWR